LTPRLRRYARALTQASPAPNDAVDELLHATFTRILNGCLLDRKSDLIPQVFSVLTQLYRESQPALQTGGGEPPTTSGNIPDADGFARAGHANVHANTLPKGLCAALAGLGLDEREALLLVALEEFSYLQAARILHISRGCLIARLGRARARLGEALADVPISVPARRVAHLRLVK
jgi:RNA polymerase sigma-70 factor (ECF subfamily)